MHPHGHALPSPFTAISIHPNSFIPIHSGPRLHAPSPVPGACRCSAISSLLRVAAAAPVRGSASYTHTRGRTCTILRDHTHPPCTGLCAGQSSRPGSIVWGEIYTYLTPLLRPHREGRGNLSLLAEERQRRRLPRRVFRRGAGRPGRRKRHRRLHRFLHRLGANGWSSGRLGST